MHFSPKCIRWSVILYSGCGLPIHILFKCCFTYYKFGKMFLIKVLAKREFMRFRGFRSARVRDTGSTQKSRFRGFWFGLFLICDVMSDMWPGLSIDRRVGNKMHRRNSTAPPRLNCATETQGSHPRFNIKDVQLYRGSTAGHRSSNALPGSTMPPRFDCAAVELHRSSTAQGGVDGCCTSTIQSRVEDYTGPSWAEQTTVSSPKFNISWTRTSRVQLRHLEFNCEEGQIHVSYRC